MSERIAVIVCGGTEGRPVVVGWVDELPAPGESVTIYDAKMVLYWSEACGGLFGLSQRGPQKGSRVTCSVPIAKDTCRQMLTVSEAAMEAFRSWPDA